MTMKKMLSCLLLIALLTLAFVPAFADDSVLLTDPAFCEISSLIREPGTAAPLTVRCWQPA